MIAKVALRDDDSAPLALVHRLARLTAARLALLTSSPMGVTAVRGFRGLAAMRPQAELALEPLGGHVGGHVAGRRGRVNHLHPARDDGGRTPTRRGDRA
jgi:hypothetical protein